jgi:hypothetical protein
MGATERAEWFHLEGRGDAHDRTEARLVVPPCRERALLGTCAPGQPVGSGVGEVTTSLDVALMPCAKRFGVQAHRQAHYDDRVTEHRHCRITQYGPAPTRIAAAGRVPVTAEAVTAR